MLTPLVHRLRSGVVPLVIIAFIGVLGTLFHLRAEALMAGQLRERLQSTAAIAAGQFDPFDISLVRNADDAGSPSHRRLVELLRHTRDVTPGVQFAYLVRSTDDPTTVMFIADADEFLSDAALDRDGNGVVDNDEAPSIPGETYSIAAMDAFQRGFHAPSVDRDATYDRWGALMSGYAPVRDDRGNTIAVLGIDMSASDFLSITHSIFSPFVFILVLIGGAMLSLFSYSVVQRRRLESMRLLEDERTALLDLAMHQLGMPLATFRWWLEILRDRTEQSSGDVEAYSQLQLGVDRMDHILRSLQDAARLHDEGMTYDAVRMDPVAFAHDVVASMQPAFDLKKQRATVECDGDVPSVMIDRKLMSGVLGELLENARGFSPEGSAITVRVTRGRSEVLIDVIDRGCGIPADQIPRMFQKFTRGKNAYSTKPVGNGLGLYICKGIVERGGGRLTVKSIEGKGTTVTLALPLAP